MYDRGLMISTDQAMCSGIGKGAEPAWFRRGELEGISG